MVNGFSLDDESHDKHADGSHQDAIEHKKRPVFFRNVGNTEESAHVLNLGSHQKERRGKNCNVVGIESSAGEQTGCNTDTGPAGEPSGAQNSNCLTGKIKDAHDRAADFT